jgi:hypothetical protein
MNDNFSNPLEAMLASPESGEFTPPDLASRRDSSPYQGKGEPVVTRASPAAHLILWENSNRHRNSIADVASTAKATGAK